MYGDGYIETELYYEPVKELKDMPEFGVIFKFDADYENVSWYGMGYEETYADRCRGAKLGIYNNKVKDNMAKYLNPQECGNKTGVRWASVTDSKGRGMLFTGNKVEFSALPYTPHEMENARHDFELPQIHYTVVRVSKQQMGVGGDDSLGEQRHTKNICLNTEEPIRLFWLLTNIKAADPDIIFAPSSITTAPLIIKQARELGITATIAAGDTWENSTIIENAGADSEGVVISTFFDEAEPANDEAAAFIKGFKEYLVKEKQEDIIPAVSALGYDSYLAAIKAIEDAGSTDTTAIRDALKNVEIDGVTGNITFNETGDANKDIAFIKTIKDGRFQFLTTTTVE